MAKIEQNTTTKFRQGRGRSEIPIHGWWEAHEGQTLWKAAWQFLMDKYLPYDPAIPFPVENKNTWPPKCLDKNVDFCRIIYNILSGN